MPRVFFRRAFAFHFTHTALFCFPFSFAFSPTFLLYPRVWLFPANTYLKPYSRAILNIRPFPQVTYVFTEIAAKSPDITKKDRQKEISGALQKTFLQEAIPTKKCPKN